MKMKTIERLPPYDGKPQERTLIIDDALLAKVIPRHRKIINPGFINDQAARACVKFRYQPALYNFWVNVFYRTESFCEAQA